MSVAMDHTLITHCSSKGRNVTIIISSVIKLRIPATSANLGPGFDCLGLALDLWNEVNFDQGGKPGFFVEGEGAELLNSHPDNLLTQAMDAVYEECGAKKSRLRITSDQFHSIEQRAGLQRGGHSGRAFRRQ